MNYFQNKKVLITGGSSGIGLAMAKAAVGVGAHAIILGRDMSKLCRAKAEIEDLYSTKVEVLSLDIGVEDSFTDAVKDRLLEFDIDVLINCAGIGGARSFEDTSVSSFHDYMNTNFFGSLVLSKILVPQIISKADGRIVFVSSVAGLLGLYGFTAYSASKFAIEGLAQSLRNELAIGKSKVCVLYPPDTDTPMLAAENAYKPAVTKALSEGVVLSAEYVADAALKGIADGKYQIIPGFRTKLNCFLIQHFPGLMRRYLDFVARTIAAKSQ